MRPARNTDAIDPLPLHLRRQLHGALAHNNGHTVCPSQRFQPCGQIDCVAQNSIAAADAGPHVAHTDHATVDAYSQMDNGLACPLLLRIEVRQHGGNVACCLHGQPGMLFYRQGRSPEHHDAITNVLVDGAVVGRNDLGDPVEQPV